MNYLQLMDNSKFSPEEEALARYKMIKSIADLYNEKK